MPFAIGLRIYSIIAPLKGARAPNNVKGRISNKDLLQFVSSFVESHATPANREDLQRGWHMESKPSANAYMVHGYVHYGTYGFESTLIDGETRRQKYKRQTIDLEEIPLYFKYWIPENDKFGLFAFQSFSGRSCIQMLLSDMQHEFETKNPNNTLRVRKLMPNEADNKDIANARVKRLTMISNNASGDIADRYLHNGSPDKVDVEFTIKSKRKGSLGKFSNLLSTSGKEDGSMLVYDGIHFDTAKAVISIGGRYRTVGVLGYSNDAGLIDLTDQIKRGVDGHPIFHEISKETDDILTEFYNTQKTKS